jgi:dynein heavy chain 2, cytosolic
VLTRCARQAVAEPLTRRTWIVCDGDIDPEWIEALNSVLDDNHLLTMPNGERIQFAHNVNFIFECHSVSFASPATISRCGIIYTLSDPLSMVQRAVATFARCMGPATHNYTDLTHLLHKALAWIDAHPGSLAICMTAHGIIGNALSQISLDNAAACAPKIALGRGIAAALNPESRAAFLQIYMEWSSEAAPAWGAPAGVQPLELLQPLVAVATPFTLPDGMVDTDALRSHLAVVAPWLKGCKPFVLCGPRGSGKGTVLRAAVAAMPGVAMAELACSSETLSEHVVHKLFQVTPSAAAHGFSPKKIREKSLF